MKLYPEYIKRWNLAAVAAALVICVGCSDEIGLDIDDFDQTTSPSDCLAFTTRIAPGSRASESRASLPNLEIVEEQWVSSSEAGKVASRGTLINQLSGDAGVLAYQYNVDGSDNPIDIEPVNIDGDNNLAFSFDGFNLVSKDAIILWHDIVKTNLDVCAYAPYESATAAPAAEPDSLKLVDLATMAPKIDYIVPDWVANQKDLLVANWKSSKQADPLNYKNKTIPLTFNHALTAIRFKGAFTKSVKVKSVEIRNVYNHGIFNLSESSWEIVSPSESSARSASLGASEPSNATKQHYKLDFGEGLAVTNNFLNENNPMILMPQTLPADAALVLTCEDESGADKDYTMAIGGMDWRPGKLITYTFHEGQAPETIYFDLAAGDVIITADVKGKGSCSGAVFDGDEVVPLTYEYNKYDTDGKLKPYHIYVYQSSSNPSNRAAIWPDGVGVGKKCNPPQYNNITAPDGRSWREFITNNTNVDEVIDAWCADSDTGNDQIATDAGREPTGHRIEISGNVTCDLTIDNIYSTYQDARITARRTGGISFEPQFIPAGAASASAVKNAKVTIKSVGDNRVGAVHYCNTQNNGNQIIFEGTGSLTVADVNGIKGGDSNSGLKNGKGYWYNHWCTAIGGCDDSHHEICYGIVINSGIIYAGTTKAENCTALGGGGNEFGEVTINGGTVTAVATTTGTAIGGGIGFGSPGGQGKVVITGGNVYAYNHANKWAIPSSAIGGAGSKGQYGNKGNVKISGGNVYAESGSGTAIGGGSSYTLQGGDANVEITGGNVVAKTLAPGSASIGGGTACSSTKGNYNGGSAEITISGNPIIRTGSIGGGGKGVGSGYIGNAKIKISGGDIQGQFVLAAGTSAGVIPSFEMTGGLIRNNNATDNTYINSRPDGGAVNLENGNVKISGGTIRDCTANRGGAIFIAGSTRADGTSSATFKMSGGLIKGNEAVAVDGVHDDGGGGGAVYIINGEVTLTGGEIIDNLAAGGNGGGIFISQGSLTIEGEVDINGNNSEVRSDNNGGYSGGNGGGVYVYSKESDVAVSLKSGKIMENTADRRGGGLCVIQDGMDKKAVITIGAENALNELLQITQNHCLLQGGGVFAKGPNADITINSGTIQNNSVSQYVYNENVANENGSVTLNGGDVTHNVVTFNANDGSDNPQTSTQKIVTKTNSVLKAPDFRLLGYSIEKWTTKPSGAGDSYTDGDIININQNITLYAQWKKWTQ